MVNWTKPAQDQAKEHSNEVEDWAHGLYPYLEITVTWKSLKNAQISSWVWILIDCLGSCMTLDTVL